MADVSISIEARDQVSQTLDAITASVAQLNNALEEMEKAPGPDTLKRKLRATADEFKGAVVERKAEAAKRGESHDNLNN